MNTSHTTTPRVPQTQENTRYIARRKVFKLFGGAFHVYDEAGQLAFYCGMKAFKLKEDLRVYADESAAQEMLRIQARQVIDFSASYDVFDSVSGEKVGALRRRGFKSMIKDEWVILDTGDRAVGMIREDSMLRALLRRFVNVLALFMPQKYHAEIGGVPVCTYTQNRNPFVHKLTIDFSMDTQRLLDRRLAVAAAILLLAIEGRQK